MAHGERSRSIWTDTAQLPSFQSLHIDGTADVCVVGAGIAGLTTAYLLAKAGRNVTVLDRGALGGRQTPQTTAHVTAALDDRYDQLEKFFGEEGAALAAQAHTFAICEIERIVAAESIACDLESVDAYLFCAPGDDPTILDREFEAARRAGLDVALVDRAPYADPFDTGRALRFAGQAQLHPLKYLDGLVDALRGCGAKLYENTTVVSVDEETDRVRVCTADGAELRCIDAVVATNVPIAGGGGISLKQAPYTTYVVGLRVERGSIPSCIAYDTPDPYHYIRTYAPTGASYDVLIVGGEDDPAGTTDDGDEHFASLEAWTRERFPHAQERLYAWSGQILEPADALAYIGRNPGTGHIYLATGDSGNGITHGTIAGMLVRDLILGIPNPWEELFAPGRISTRPEALLEVARAGVGVVRDLAEYATPGDVASEDDIPSGAGAIVRDGVKKLAVYRDDAGAFHRFSAACTHLGCIVHWNSTDREWDCPCHGSRFDALGTVVNGPAIDNLTPHASD